MLNAAQKGTSFYITRGTCAPTHKHTQTHTHMCMQNTHALGNTNSAMHLNYLQSICLRTFSCAGVVLGIRRGVTGSVGVLGCWLFAILIPLQHQ